MIEVKNIFSNISSNTKDEILETLVRNESCKIERIISNTHSTEKNKWYDQDKNEFVLLLKGSAELLFFPNELIKLKEGDYLIIPSHKKHRVEKTAEETIWLTVFY